MITAVDTNVLLDVLNKDEEYFEVSREFLEKALRSGSLIISEVVYAELASQFSQKREVDEFLNDTDIRLQFSNREALWEATKAWNGYIARRSEQLECSHCGTRILVRCKNCSDIITCRQHIISDFLIGGHAKVLADSFLTRDRGYYRAYFKDLSLFS